MCQVIIENANANQQFIIYNHVFSQDRPTFTIQQLVQELKQYNLVLTEADIKETIKDFVRSGLLYQYYNCYAVRER